MYYEPDDCYIVYTGDFENMCHVLRGRYDSELDSWSWEEVFTPDYSTSLITLMIFIGTDIYYGIERVPSEIKKCAYADLADVTKHETIFVQNGYYTSTIRKGTNNELIITSGENAFYISRDYKNFVLHRITGGPVLTSLYEGYILRFPNNNNGIFICENIRLL